MIYLDLVAKSVGWRSWLVGGLGVSWLWMEDEKSFGGSWVLERFVDE